MQPGVVTGGVVRVIARLAACAGACLLAVGCELPEHPTLALRDVAVVDVADGTVHPGRTVLISGDRILAVGAEGRVDVPDGVDVVDGRGRYLIPGLIDMHVHALWHPSVPPTFLPLFVANGVTTVRDMGGTLEVLRATRVVLADGAFPAPRVIAAGAILDGPTPVHPDVSIPVSTPGEAVAAVEAVAAAGADFVKVYTLLPDSAFDAAMAAARERGLTVSGHVPADVGPVAAAAGMRTMEHLMSELGGFCAGDDPAGCEATVSALRRNGTWQVATLVIQGETEATALCGDPRLRFLTPAVREYWFGPGRAPAGCDTVPGGTRFEPPLPAEARLVPVLHEAGVPLLAGTDAGVPYALPGWSLHDELRLLVEAGLRPLDALRAATSEAARALGRGDLGAIRPGYRADLVLLSANPLDGIGNTERIEGVVSDGRWLDRGRLDRVLSGVAERAATGAGTGDQLGGPREGAHDRDR